MPLLLSHGWPGSIWEFPRIIPLLTVPASHGGDASDAFTVVAPSLPGYTLSFEPCQKRYGIADIAQIFDALMHDVLGYETFAAQGGDWGSFVSAYLAYSVPEHLRGIHINLLPLRREPLPAPSDAESPDVVAYRKELDTWLAKRTATRASRAPNPRRSALR